MPNLVDANILLRIILQDNAALSAQAQQILNKAEPGSLIVTPVIAAEVLYVLGPKNYTRQQGVDALMLLFDRPQFKRSELLVGSLNFYAQTRLDYADCYLLARALTSGEGLRTLDDQLQKTYKRLK